MSDTKFVVERTKHGCCTVKTALSTIVVFVLGCLVVAGVWVTTSSNKHSSVSFTVADWSMCSQVHKSSATTEGISEYFAGARRSLEQGSLQSGLSEFIAVNNQQSDSAKGQYKKPLDKLHFLITGGAGYIGSHAVLELLERNHQVTVIDNLSRGHLGALLELDKYAKLGQLAFYDLDLGDAAELQRLFIQLVGTSPIDVVIHFAAVAYVGESIADPLLYYANVTSNTANLLRAMSTSKVKNIIYSSSCATYGNAKKMPITERTPQIPTSPYGKSKLLAEQMLIEHTEAQGINAVILRYFNVIGSDPKQRVGESPRSEVSKRFGRISGSCFAAALGQRDSLTIMGTDHNTTDGTCVRDYIHVVDLVRAHIAAIVALRRNTSGVSVYNVGLGGGYSVREFVDACRNVTGVDIKIVEGPRREGDPATVFADTSKVRQDLNWEPQYTNLRESLMHAWKWSQSAKY